MGQSCHHGLGAGGRASARIHPLHRAVRAPRIVGTAWASVVPRVGRLHRRDGQMEMVDAAAALVGIIALSFPCSRSCSCSARMADQCRTIRLASPPRAGRSGVGRRVPRRSVSGGACWAWWPDSRPLPARTPVRGGHPRPGRGGAACPRRGDGAESPPPWRAATRDGAPGAGDALPTRHPQPCPLWCPSPTQARRVGGEPASTQRRRTATRRPDRRPRPGCSRSTAAAAGQGDNQALAVNTTDGTVTYDVASRWCGSPTRTCSTPTRPSAPPAARAAPRWPSAFQVVLIVGDADVVVPQNLAAAVNYNCFRCITAAIAGSSSSRWTRCPARSRSVGWPRCGSRLSCALPRPSPS